VTTHGESHEVDAIRLANEAGHLLRQPMGVSGSDTWHVVVGTVAGGRPCEAIGDQIGADRVLWGNDYPHYEGTFPYNLESLRLTFADVPEDQRRKLLGLNAAHLYRFDLEKLKPLAAKYGPRPDQVSQPLPRDEIPRDSTCYLFQNALYGL